MINEVSMIKLFVVSAGVLILLDFIYLFLQQEWYKKEIKKIQGAELKLNWAGVFMRYLAQIIGLNIFVLQNNGSILNSFLFGIIIYLNYIGTSYATIINFDELLAFVDLLKGGVIMGLTTYITYLILNVKV
jgi:uncharacterized membrane protein